jgi:hypothetical protein
MTQGLPPPDVHIAYRKAFRVAALLELAWRLLPLPGAPPIVRALVRMQGKDFIVSDRKARAELGYAPPVSRAAGLAALAVARTDA